MVNTLVGAAVVRTVVGMEAAPSHPASITVTVAPSGVRREA